MPDSSNFPKSIFRARLKPGPVLGPEGILDEQHEINQSYNSTKLIHVHQKLLNPDNILDNSHFDTLLPLGLMVAGMIVLAWPKKR